MRTIHDAWQRNAANRGETRRFLGAARRALRAGFAGALLLTLLVPASVGCGGDDDDCLNHGENCSKSYLEKEGRSGATCCDNRVCCALAGGSGVPTCQRSGSCE